MNIIVGAFISGHFFDACLVDGYDTLTQLIYALKKNFNNESAVLDLFNYLDSDGNGTRNPFKLDLVPALDFSNDNSHFESRSLKDFMMQIDEPSIKVIAWKDSFWWIYNRFNRTWRKVK